MKRVIEVTIHPSGESQVEVSGAQGPSCLETTAFLVEALGTVLNRRRKPEYYRHAKRSTEQRLEP